jgi:hypothetical protein
MLEMQHEVIPETHMLNDRPIQYWQENKKHWVRALVRLCAVADSAVVDVVVDWVPRLCGCVLLLTVLLMML